MDKLAFTPYTSSNDVDKDISGAGHMSEEAHCNGDWRTLPQPHWQAIYAPFKAHNRTVGSDETTLSKRGQLFVDVFMQQKHERMSDDTNKGLT